VGAVGLTGGIGAGKSTALRFFAAEGATVVSADEVVHGLYQREDVRGALAGRFGPQIVSAGGEVDRRRLAEAVRGNPAELAWLESLTHPLVGEELRRVIRQAPAGAVVVCEVPLLFEADLQGLFDLVITVEARGEARRARSTHAFDLQLFGEFEALQATGERRVAGADLAFFNDGHVDHLRAFVRDAYARVLAMAATGTPSEAGQERAPGPDLPYGEEDGI
jgi:dephospho-CoA kinase